MLTGKTALVTGGSRGIGAAICTELGRYGATVLVNYRQMKTDADEVCRRIVKNGGNAATVQGDVSWVDDINRMFDEIEECHDSVDILVNNAGLEIRMPSTDYPEEVFDRMLDTNLKGAFFCAQRALKLMLRTGWGRIINVSSVHEERPTGNRSPYSISKAGMKMLTRELAKEFAAKGITVNSVIPGAIRTDMNREVLADPNYEKKVLDLIPARWIGEPEDVAPLIRFLVSEEAKYITGASITVDGGLML